MTPSSRLLTRSFLVGVLIVSGASGASALTVTRCNALVDGVYRPVLIVDHRGEKTVHHMNEDGLTRSILFDPRAAIAWAQERHGAGSVVASYVKDCGPGAGGKVPARTAAADGDDDDDDDDDDDGGGATG